MICARWIGLNQPASARFEHILRRNAVAGITGRMFFSLSKILWFLVDPANLLLMALIIGVILIWLPWRRLARWWMTLTLLYALVIAVVPIGAHMRLALENRFPPPAALPDRVDGIVVLGGTIDQFVSKDRGSIAINGAVERLFALADLAQKYPETKLVFTGGSGVLTDQSVKEADYIAPILKKLGVAPSRVVYERESRNTAENAVFTKRLVQPKPGENWIVITSAFHMPRAMGVFRRANWPVIPYPVDYGMKSAPPLSITFNLQSGLNNFSGALHEWLGLTFYWLTDRTNQLYPAPDAGNTGS
jgi:uncharacterized SAM-binding protein YcdF (DUF218 family)